MKGKSVVEWYEPEVQWLERTVMQSPPREQPVIFYGSSSIRLWSTMVEDLGDPRVLNLGFGGSTMAACDHFFERLIVPRRPISLVLYAGDNDLGDGRSPQDVLASLRSLIQKLDLHLGSISFAFISIKPSPARWSIDSAIRSTNSLIREQLERRSRSHYIDVYTSMLGPNGYPRPDLYADDGLHLSPNGYQVWTHQILRHRHAIF